MNVVYATVRQVKTDPYSFVESIDRLFLEEKNAQEYVRMHNELYPNDIILMKAHFIADAMTGFTVEPFDYVKGVFAFTEEECLKEAFESRTGNVLEIAEDSFRKIEFYSSTTYSLGAFRLKSTEKFSFEANSERQRKKVYHFAFQTKIEKDETIDQVMEQMSKRAKDYHRKLLDYKKVGQFATDETLENWLNDPQFDLEELKNFLK